MADDITPGALGHPLEFPAEFKQWLTDYVATQTPKFPISQVFGYQLQRVRTATVDASETRATNSYGDLATVGPTLSNLANGWYILVFGADTASSATAGGTKMSPQINGVAAVDDNACSFIPLYPTPARTSNLRMVMVHLDAGTNEIIMKYKQASGTGTFQFRFLHALKVLSLDE